MKFHSTDYFKPTREFNADDVLFTFERMLDKDHPFRKAYPTEFPYFTDMGLDKNIARIEKLDEHRVKFTLNEVDAAFIQNLAMPFPSIQSAEYAAQLLKQGQGQRHQPEADRHRPFVFSRYQKDAQIRFKGNKDYWKPDEVKVDNLIFAINTDASVRAQKLKGRRVPDHPQPTPRRPRRAEEGPEPEPAVAGRLQPRLHRRQRHPQAVRQAGSTPGAGHGGEQEGLSSTLSTRAPASWRATACRRPSGPTTRPSRTRPLRSGQGPGSC